MQEINDRNSFDYLKLVASIIVLLSHAFSTFSVKKPFLLGLFTDGSIGVIILFSISGFLAFLSFDRVYKQNNDFLLSVKKFYIKRFLRIYPMLIITYCVMSLIDFFVYKINIFSINYFLRFVYRIIKIGSHSCYDGVVSNGVLWTMKTQILSYILVPFIYYYLNKKSIKCWLLLIFFLWQFNIFDYLYVQLKPEYIFKQTSPIYFMYEIIIGCFICNLIIVRKKNIFNCKNMTFILLIFTLWYFIYYVFKIIPKFGVVHNCVTGLIVSFFTIAIGVSLKTKKKKYDISYCLYLYHMLVIQVFAGICTDRKMMYISIFASFIVAQLMHIIVEKRITKLINVIKR